MNDEVRSEIKKSIEIVVSEVDKITEASHTAQQVDLSKLVWHTGRLVGFLEYFLEKEEKQSEVI